MSTPASRNETELRRALPGIASKECGGDNLSILLASYFEPGIESEELDASGTWKQGAIDAANSVLDAIHAHYASALAERDALRAEVEQLREALEWYGEQARRCRSEGTNARHNLMMDAGDRARAALKGGGHE